MQEEIGKTTNSAVVSYKDLHALGEIKYFVALHAFPDTLLWLFIMFNAQVAALRQAQDRSPKAYSLLLLFLHLAQVAELVDALA